MYTSFRSELHYFIEEKIHLFSLAFEKLNICFRHSFLKMTILGAKSTNCVNPSTMLQNSLSKQQNCSTPSNPQMLSTIPKTVRHLYTMIDNLIKLLGNQQNEFETNKKANNQVHFSLASFNTSASPPFLTPQCRFLL